MRYKRYRNYNNFGLFDFLLKPIIDDIKPKIKGAVGEIGIGFMLGILDPNNYRIINNLILSENGKTSQIDHVVVSNYGIFVIETKNYKGLIFGDDKNTYWTQVLYGSREKLYNPVRQNMGHLHVLKESLNEYKNIPFHCIIVFSEDAELKVSSSSIVGYPMDMLDFIKSCTKVALSDVERDSIMTKLNGLKKNNQGLMQEHINSIKKGIQEKERKIKGNLCPQCGGNMVLRQSKFGSFKGCSNYPSCKFTVKE